MWWPGRGWVRLTACVWSRGAPAEEVPVTKLWSGSAAPNLSQELVDGEVSLCLGITS